MPPCRICGEAKHSSEFYRHSGRDDWMTHCKACHLERMKQWERDNPERRQAVYKRYRAKNPDHNRKQWLKKYGLTITQYAELLAEQGGVCAICGVGPNGKNLSVDHCHETGRVRGLLCAKCNTGIGQFEDSIETLKRALEYLLAEGKPSL